MDKHRRATRSHQKGWEKIKVWGQTDGRRPNKKLGQRCGWIDTLMRRIKMKKSFFIGLTSLTEPIEVIGARVSSNRFGKWYSRYLRLHTQGIGPP